MTNLVTSDLSGVTVKWAGAYMDGSPVTGRLLLTYNGDVMLDDANTPPTDFPVAIFPKQLALPITTNTIMVDGVSTTVGYCEATIPASNDPDIAGSGGTYTFTEDFTGGRKNVSFVADIDTPGGVIWLNKIVGTDPVEGEPLSVVYYADFTDLKSRVDALELGGVGGGVSSWFDLTDKPTEFPPSAHTHVAADVTDLASLLAAKADATDLAGKADAVDTQAALDQKADLAHSHAVADVTGLQIDLDNKADTIHDHDAGDIVSGTLNVGRAWLGGVVTVIYDTTTSTWPAAPTANPNITRIYICANPAAALPSDYVAGKDLLVQATA